MKTKEKPSSKTEVKVLKAKTMKNEKKKLLNMAGRSGRNQAGCCG